MHGPVEEREQAEHPPKADRSVPSTEPPQWRDGQRDTEKTQGPETGDVCDRLQWIGAEIPRDKSSSKEQRERNQRREEHRWLDQPADCLVRCHGKRPRGRIGLEILPQVHTSVHAGHLIAVAVEELCLRVLEERRQTTLRCLAPAGMIDLRIHIGVEAVLSWGRLLPGVQRLL